MKDISVVIVTFNNEETIKKCLDSILQNSPGVEVVVVDNNSSDRTVEIVKSFKEEVVLVEAGANLGFSKANNLGETRVKSEYIIFLNPDTQILHKGSLEKLQAVLVNHPDFGLIGPKLVYPDGQVQKTVRNLPTVSKAFNEYILRVKGSYGFYLPECGGVCEVESVVGACMVMRRDIFDNVGRFNGKYFLYFEDLDLCRAVKDMGLKVGFYPEVEIRHNEGVSGKGQKTNKFLHESAKRYHGLLGYYLIQWIIRAGRVLYG